MDEAISTAANLIPARQNRPEQLDQLAAQRGLHAKEKRVVAWQLLLTVLIPVVLSYGRLWKPSLLAWAALYGVVLTLADATLLDWLQQHFRKKAVLVQELFDTEVLGLEWPEWCEGHKPDHESISREAKALLQCDPNVQLADWYPPAVGRLPLGLARLVCQRANLWYDVSLRRRFMYVIFAIIASIALAPLIISLARRMTMDQVVLTLMAPMLPVVQWCVREVWRHNRAVHHNEHLKQYIGGLLERGAADEADEESLRARARLVQDGILMSRLSKPPVFDWFYQRLRKRNEEDMNEGARRLVERLVGGRRNSA